MKKNKINLDHLLVIFYFLGHYSLVERKQKIKIASSINKNVIVDLSGSNSDADVLAYQYQWMNSQKWRFSYNEGRKAYTISNSGTPNLVLTWLQDGKRVVGHRNIKEPTTSYSVRNNNNQMWNLINRP